METTPNSEHPLLSAMQRLLYVVREIHAGNAFSEAELWRAYQAGASELDRVRSNRPPHNPLRDTLETLLVHSAAVYKCFDPTQPLKRARRPHRLMVINHLAQVMDNTRSLLRTEGNPPFDYNLVGALSSAAAMIDEMVRQVPDNDTRSQGTATLASLRKILKTAGDRTSGYADLDVIPHIRCNATPMGLDIEMSADLGKTWATIDIYRHDTRRLSPCYQPSQGYDSHRMARAYFELLDLRGIRYVRAPALTVH